MIPCALSFKLAQAHRYSRCHTKRCRYGLCERKVGKPMPSDNGVVAEARLKIGVDMPTVAPLFEEYKERVDNVIRDR